MCTRIDVFLSVQVSQSQHFRKKLKQDGLDSVSHNVWKIHVKPDMLFLNNNDAGEQKETV